MSINCFLSRVNKSPKESISEDKSNRYMMNRRRGPPGNACFGIFMPLPSKFQPQTY